MSSVAERLDAPAGPRTPRTVTVAVPRLASSTAIAIGVTAVLLLAAFIARGGLQLEPTSRVLIGLMLCGGLLVGLAAVRAPRTQERRLHGAVPALAFALLGAFTAVSILWSLAPADSWVEANRTFAYLATFLGAVALARLVPWGWTGLLGGLAAGCVILSAWALLTKVFPGALAEEETFGRLRAPFEYWNSVGLMAALGTPPLLWLASRRQGSRVANALAWPALGLVLVCVMLSYSRGALLALLVGVVFWVAAVPLRRASLIALAGATLGAAPIVAWAFQQDGLTTDKAPLAARVDAGHELGALLLLACAALLAGGIAFEFIRSQRAPSPARRVSGRIVWGGLAALIVAGAVAAALAPGSPGDRLGGSWDRLTDPNARTPANTPDRLTATSSVRARYWAEAFDVHAVSPWIGTGAGAYAVARTRFRQDTLAVRHAHGYVPQTLADLGWVGLGLSLLVLLAWAASAARATGMRRRDRGLYFDAERVGAFALVTVVIIFGVHSALDWTWFVPANVVAALIAAGWVAGSRPLRDRMTGSRAEPAATVATRGPGRWKRPLTELRSHPLAGLVVLLIVAITLTAAWTAYQPVRSLHASDEAFERLDVGAYDAASSVATIAAERNPLSVDPLFDLAAVEQARGQRPAAERALERAVQVQPANAETWRRLGRFHLDVALEPRRALEEFQAASFLDPKNPTSTSDILLAARAVEADGG